MLGIDILLRFRIRPFQGRGNQLHQKVAHESGNDHIRTQDFYLEVFPPIRIIPFSLATNPDLCEAESFASSIVHELVEGS